LNCTVLTNKLEGHHEINIGDYYFDGILQYLLFINDVSVHIILKKNLFFSDDVWGWNNLSLK